MRLTLKILIFNLLAGTAFGQSLITPDQAVDAARRSHPLLKAATFEVQARKYGEKSSLNLANPEINTESPTGTFYAIGVSQAFEFPTVYLRQKQVAKAETALAQASQQITENDLRYTVRATYLDMQVAIYRARQWAERDSLYQAIGAAASRQFSAGEIDFLQKTMAENEANNIHRERVAAETEQDALRSQLMLLIGETQIINILPLDIDTTLFLPNTTSSNPSLLYEQQATQVAERQISLAKSKALPNFSLGYLNQGARNTPLDYRFKASIGVPLWAGQYRAGVKISEAEKEAAAARVEAQGISLTMTLERKRMDATIALANIQYYVQEGLPRSTALMTAAARMRTAGQIDYITYLRTLDEAFKMQADYTNQVQSLNSAQIEMHYLKGE